VVAQMFFIGIYSYLFADQHEAKLERVFSVWPIHYHLPLSQATERH